MAKKTCHAFRFLAIIYWQLVQQKQTFLQEFSLLVVYSKENEYNFDSTISSTVWLFANKHRRNFEKVIENSINSVFVLSSVSFLIEFLK